MKKVMALFILVVVLLSGCNGRSNKGDDKITVTVSIEPQRYLVEKIAGDKVDVKTLLPQGAKPETYDLTPSQLVDLTESDAYFMMGTISFERSWADAYTSDHPHTNIFVMSNGINHIVSDHFHCHESVEDDCGEYIEPHIWLSVKNVKYMMENVYDGLVIVDPDNREYYRSRYDSVMKEIYILDSKIDSIMQGADKAFMIYHPALTYFARDYGLKQISIESDGKEPSPSQLLSIIKEAKEQNVKVIFIQSEFDPRNAQIVAEETGCELVQFNPLSYNWGEEMLHVAKVLSNR